MCGAFPIQSNPGKVTEEIITNKVNGLLIDNPEDISEIAHHIEYAVSNINMVRDAIKINSEIVKTKLEYNHIKEKIIEFYKNVI